MDVNKPVTMPASSSTCYFTDKIPAEIRNNIYELAFVPKQGYQWSNEPGHDELPPKDLLITCRQVYKEARLLYREIHRKFWSTSSFNYVASEDTTATKIFNELPNLKEEVDIESLPNFSITCPGGSYKLLDVTGGWRHGCWEDGKWQEPRTIDANWIYVVKDNIGFTYEEDYLSRRSDTFRERLGVEEQVGMLLQYAYHPDDQERREERRVFNPRLWLSPATRAFEP